MPGPRSLPALAALAVCAGCGGDRPLTGSLDLPDRPVATGLDVVGFTGRVTRGSSVTAILAGGGRGTVVVEPSGRFSAAVDGLRPGVNVVRVRARRRARAPWRRTIRVTRRSAPPVVRVPREDVTPPVAMLQVHRTAANGGVLTVSPSALDDEPRVVRLDRPELRATAVVRDDGGAGRLRLSTVYRIRCGKRWRPVRVSLPPAQIENVKLAPASLISIEKTRTATIPLETEPGCTTGGEVWAEATDGQGLLAVSRHVAFTYDPGRG